MRDLEAAVPPPPPPHHHHHHHHETHQPRASSHDEYHDDDDEGWPTPCSPRRNTRAGTQPQSSGLLDSLRRSTPLDPHAVRSARSQNHRHHHHHHHHRRLLDGQGASSSSSSSSTSSIGSSSSSSSSSSNIDVNGQTATASPSTRPDAYADDARREKRGMYPRDAEVGLARSRGSSSGGFLASLGGRQASPLLGWDEGKKGSARPRLVGRLGLAVRGGLRGRRVLLLVVALVCAAYFWLATPHAPSSGARQRRPDDVRVGTKTGTDAGDSKAGSRLAASLNAPVLRGTKALLDFARLHGVALESISGEPRVASVGKSSSSSSSSEPLRHADPASVAVAQASPLLAGTTVRVSKADDAALRDDDDDDEADEGAWKSFVPTREDHLRLLLLALGPGESVTASSVGHEAESQPSSAPTRPRLTVPSDPDERRARFRPSDSKGFRDSLAWLDEQIGGDGEGDGGTHGGRTTQTSQQGEGELARFQRDPNLWRAEHTPSLWLLTKSYCPYSARAKRLLLSLGVASLRSVEVDLREDAAAVKALLGEGWAHDTFPAVFVSNALVGGYSDLESLHDAGVLHGMLAAAGALS